MRQSFLDKKGTRPPTSGVTTPRRFMAASCRKGTRTPTTVVEDFERIRSERIAANVD